jgi:hypothetical protein
MEYGNFEPYVFLNIFGSACASGNINIAKFVLEKNALDISSHYLYVRFKSACICGQKNMAEWLLGLGFIDVTFGNYEIYQITSHVHIKNWLCQFVYGFTPTFDVEQVRPSSNGYRHFGCYYLYTGTHSQNFDKKCFKPKEKHPRKMLTKYPIKNNKLYR